MNYYTTKDHAVSLVIPYEISNLHPNASDSNSGQTHLHLFVSF